MTELRQREPRVEDKAFLAFVRTRRCAACGAPPPNHAAHIRMACPERGKRATGKGERPSDKWAVPLCQSCHQDAPGAQHKGAEAAFWRRVGLDPFAIAAMLYEEFTSANASRSPNKPSQVKRATDSGAKVRRPKKPSLIGLAYSMNNVKKNRPRRQRRRWPSRPLHGTVKWPTRKMRNWRRSTGSSTP